jgi:hypothetical protein
VSRLPTLTMWSMAAAAVLSPVLGFLMTIIAEILLGLVKEAGVPASLWSSPPAPSAGSFAACGGRALQVMHRHGPESALDQTAENNSAATKCSCSVGTAGNA